MYKLVKESIRFINLLTRIIRVYIRKYNCNRMVLIRIFRTTNQIYPFELNIL